MNGSNVEVGCRVRGRRPCGIALFRDLWGTAREHWRELILNDPPGPFTGILFEMKVGFVGLGKLGLPCAVAIAMKGHDVMGYDIDGSLMNKSARPYRETGPDGQEPFSLYLEHSTIAFGALDEVVAHSEILFVAVQTPHDPAYGGGTRRPGEPVDFDYRFLSRAIQD